MQAEELAALGDALLNGQQKLVVADLRADGALAVLRGELAGVVMRGGVLLRAFPADPGFLDDAFQPGQLGAADLVEVVEGGFPPVVADAFEVVADGGLGDSQPAGDFRLGISQKGQFGDFAASVGEQELLLWVGGHGGSGGGRWKSEIRMKNAEIGMQMRKSVVSGTPQLGLSQWSPPTADS